MREDPPSDATVRLLKLEQPSPHVERLLGKLLVRVDLVPKGACQIRDPELIPKELRRIAKLAAMSGRAWSCWTDRTRTWLVTGEMLVPESRERGAPVLQVDVHDEDGPNSALWMIDRDGNWARCDD
jgi:hypothetical protein